MSDGAVWYLGVNGQQQGPYAADQLIEMVRDGRIDQSAYVYGPGMASWSPLASVSPFAQAFHGPGVAPPPAPPSGSAADEIDYEVFGAEMQYVEIVLDPQEAAIAEAGAFMYMDPEIQMETIFGDGSAQQQQSGFMGKLMSAGKRLLTGESLFMTVFGNAGGGRRKVAFAAPYPGKIVPVDLQQYGGAILCQKDAFLCAAKGISVGMAFQKKLGTGFFGGEGFILQKLEGDGLAFVHAGGTLLERYLEPGETLRFDTGCLVAFEQHVNYDIQWIGGVKSALFGGEGLFYASLTGPGRVWLQSLPFSRMADRILKEGVAHQSGRGQGEGSILGNFGLGD